MSIPTRGVTVVVAALAAGAALGGIPEQISFQGRLLDAGGDPVADGTYSITFRLYDLTDANVWSETQSGVQTVGGLFSVLLGSVSSLSAIDFSGPLELSVQVSGDTEMTPRFKLASAPYALMARQAVQAADLALPKQLSTTSNLGLQVTTSNASGIALRGTASSATGTTYGVYGESTSGSGYGVYSQGRMHATAAISSASNIISGSEFRYSSAKTLYTGLHPCAFLKGNMNADNVWMVTYDEGGYIDSGSFLTVRLFAPVHLPEGATVTALYVYMYDNNASQDVSVSVDLLRRTYGLASSSLMANVSVTTAGQNTAILAQETYSIANPMIANGSYQYFVNVIWQPGTIGNTLRFYGCRIEYQIQDLRP